MSLPEESDLSDMSDMREGRDREISLGTSMLLGIFFALSLVCACFFGFGYTLGRKSAQATGPQVVASETNSDPFKTFKPSPATAAPPGASGPMVKTAAAGSPSLETTHSEPPPPVAPARSVTVPVKKDFDPDAEVVTTPPPNPVKASPVTPPVTRPAASLSPVPPGTPGLSYVQVSAFRRREDAEMVASALRRKGYTVFVRQEPQDNYLHVQLGPYASRKEADAMKERLSADGFLAMVK